MSKNQQSIRVQGVGAGIVLAALAAWGPATVAAQDTGEWALSGVARMDTVRGERALRLASGRAVRPDVRFRDGTIEFDVALTAERSFVFVQFRMASDSDYEEIYFRPHKSGLPDAIQYAPVLGGASQWQLFHGEGATAAAPLPHEGWLHVRLEVRGERAELFLGSDPVPVLTVPRLVREPEAGPVAVRGFRVGPPEREDLVAGIRNFRVRPTQDANGAGNAEAGYGAARDSESDGLVRRWRVAAPFDAGDPPWDELPPRLGEAPGWRVLDTEPNGILLIQRHLRRTPGRQTTAARLTLVSDGARTVPMDLGYSDAVTVFLDGRPIFTADDGYSFDAPRRDGLIGLDQARLYLPLEAGETELVVLVTDTFGGWGLMASFPEQNGLRIHPALTEPSSDEAGISFPVTPEVFIDEFDAAEGIAFNGEGKLFIAANRSVWRAEPTGEVTRLTDVHSNLGLAGYGPRDVLMADFGPTNATADSSENDGIVWLISPEGEKREVVRGIADPNFVLVRDDGSFLVSDDFTENIYVADTTGALSVWSDAVPYPNGLVSSLDGSELYVAQIFSGVNPIAMNDLIWAIPMEDGEPAGEPRRVAATGGAGVDGLAMDERGRVYVADNGAGKIWRIDPKSGDLTLIAEGMPRIASLVFGEGDFDRTALYVTSTFRGGGTIWKVPVGVRGASVVR